MAKWWCLLAKNYMFRPLLTYSMVQNCSWEANWFAASQEIPRISRNPKVHYRTHKRPPTASILGQPNPVHIPTSQFLQIHPNFIHPSTPRFPQWSPSLRFPHQDPIHPLTSPIRAICPTHLIFLDFITRTILGEEYKSFSSSLCNLLPSPVSTSFTVFRPITEKIWRRRGRRGCQTSQSHNPPSPPPPPQRSSI